MGSGALKNWNPIRITADTKKWVEPTLLSILNLIGENRWRINPIPAYRSKPDFGDLDFVVESGWFGGGANPVQTFARQVHPPEPIIVRNGGVNSVGVRLDDPGIEKAGIFQCDLISAPTDRYDWTLSYLSWNDVGNLVGRIARLADLKFGHDGLYYTIRNGDRFFEDVLITKDWARGITFLGFDHERWLKGFDTIEEIHEFVRASDYCTPEAFFARNQRDRYRDEKRPVYGSFVRGLEENPPESVRDVPARDDPARLAWVLDVFPEVQERIEDAQERARLRIASKDRFNATVVMRLTGRQGPALGEVMQAIRKAHLDPDSEFSPQVQLDTAIAKMSNEEIEEMVLRINSQLT